MVFSRISGLKLSHHKRSMDMHSSAIPLPERVRIPLKQHVGVACEPVVETGDYVVVGQLLGDSGEFFSAPVHSSVAGTVTAIGDFQAYNGELQRFIEVETSAEQPVITGVKRSVTDQNSLVEAARACGLVGLGGAGFPTHIKLSYKQMDKVDTLILNGAECEPYLTTDYREMLEKPDDIVDGAMLIIKALGIARAIIGIEDNKPRVIKLLEDKTRGLPVEVKTIHSVYPQGAEKVLIYNTTGRIVGEGQIPADIGVIVLNVNTVAKLNRFVNGGLPLVRKRMTVDGSLVSRPANLLVPIGTPVSYILKHAGVDISKVRKVLFGGPMMGIAIADLDTPIVKNHNALITMDEREAEHKTTACIRCGKCIDTCPVKLMPALLERAFDKGDTEYLKKLKVNLCFNCGSCSYICPAGRNLAQKNQLAKKAIPK